MNMPLYSMKHLFILYLIKYKTIDEAIALQNAVPQGLSSAIKDNQFKQNNFFPAAGSDLGALPM